MRKKKSEVGSSDAEGKPKAERPKRKASAGIGHSAIDTSHSAISKSNPDSYRDEHSKSEITNMEVHHHPQLEHKPKAWKEYLLEGFMIFVAVTMGFFAESLREHMADREREAQYMHAMVSDLQKDSIELNNEIGYTNQDIVQLDSLFRCLHSPNLTDSVQQKLYELNIKAGPLVGFEFSDAASVQLKNTGGLRLIRNQEVANAIVHYWATREGVKQDIAVFNQSVQNFWDDGLKIFDMKYAGDLVRPGTGSRSATMPGARLMTLDKIQLTEYANRTGSLVLALRWHYLKSLQKQQIIEADLERLIIKNYKF